MKKKKIRKTPIIIACILCICLLAFLIAILKNQTGGKLEQLSETDQAILTEYNTFCASVAETDIWDGYHLNEKPILAMSGGLSGGYLINPSAPVSGLFAKKLDLPADWVITVYRISAAMPDLMKFRLDDNFNTIGKTYSFLGNPVYYVKYDETTAVTTPWTSDHFTTFLSHEAFHYYMQADWPDGSRFSTENMTDEDISLLEEEYQVLA